MRANQDLIIIHPYVDWLQLCVYVYRCGNIFYFLIDVNSLYSLDEYIDDIRGNMLFVLFFQPCK